MQKEPFIINVDPRQLPNVSRVAEDEFAFEFSQTNTFRQANDDIINILRSVDEKLDFIIRILQKNTE